MKRLSLSRLVQAAVALVVVSAFPGFGFAQGQVQEEGQPAETKAADAKPADATKADDDSAKPVDKPAGQPASRPSRRSSRREEKSADGEPVVVDFSGNEAAASGRSGSGKPGPNATDSSELAPETRTLSFNFRYAPWKDVLERFAKEAKLTLDMNDVPPGTFNYYDNSKFTATEALDVINGYLLPKGFILVRRDRFLVVHNLNDPIPPNLVPQIPVSELPRRGKNELLSVVISLSDIDAKTAAEEVKELLGPQGKVVPLVKINRLFITDIGANLQRVHEMLEGMTATDSKATAFREFKLVYISATDAERTVRSLFALPPRGALTRSAAAAPTNPGNPNNNFRQQGGQDRGDWRQNFAGGGGDWRQNFAGGGGGDWRQNFAGGGGDWRQRMGGGGGDWQGGRGGDGQNNQPGQQQPGGQQSAPTAATAKIQLAVVARTNSLLVTASGEDMHLIEQAIRTIDISDSAVPRGGAVARGANVPQLEVYSLESADPRVVVDVLDSTVPGIVIYEDTKARRINVYASPSEQEQVRNIIKQLDGASVDNLVSVIHLKKLDPAGAASSLKSLFATNRQDGLSIEADALGRRLMVRGSPDQVSQVKKILSEMGEDGSIGSAAGPSGGGPIRFLGSGDRSPEELVALIERFMPQTEKSFIRVVPSSAIAPAVRIRQEDQLPGNGSRQFERKAPPASRDLEDQTPAPRGRTSNDEKRPTSGAASRPSARPASRAARDEAAEDIEELSRQLDEALRESEAGVADEADENDSGQDGESASQPNATEPHPGASEVRISVFGGKIVIASDDLEALDRVERVLQTLTEASPSKTRWSVYYLRVADATETATMLGQLFPQGSVSRTSDSGNSSIFGNLSSGLTSLGGGLMDAAGLNSLSKGGALRIVPETRTNALYITGPADQVSQVMEALSVLDAAETPESLKDRVPRMIAVKHADVNEVAEIVKDVYKEQMESPQANPLAAAANRGGGGFNPLALIMGAGGQQQGRQRGLQMTIGVDARTNSIVVSAGDQLFRQVESLVQAIDDSAREANRTVRVVSLTNANSTVVQQALTSMLGKVRVSTTNSGNTGNQGGQRPGGGPGGQNAGFNGPFGNFGGGQFGGGPFGGGNNFFQQRGGQGQGFQGGGQPFGGFQGGGQPFGAFQQFGGGQPFGGGNGFRGQQQGRNGGRN